MTEPAAVGGRRFSEYPLAPDVLAALSRLGIETPTPIQEACTGPILEGKDFVGQAETGTGKTIGFAAPMVSRIDTARVAVQALVLTPTRELAQQVAGVMEQLGAGRNLGVALVVGGVHASEQVLKLRSGSQIVVGTPGRVLDFLRDRTLSLVWCEVVVLDEADRMLDMGFIDDVSAILDKTPAERQTLLFSATIPPEIKKLLHRYMKDPVFVATKPGLATVSEIKQVYVEADFRDKFRALQKILGSLGDKTAMIFCNTRRQAIDLDRMLWGHGYSAGALHGEQEQDVRFKILDAFRAGEIKVLVATDVASRGLDIEDVGCVINYEIPDDSESYVHRIGRTGRAQKAGLAMSIVSGKEWDSWRRLLRDTGFQVERSGPERVRKGGEGGGRRGGRQGDRHGDRHGDRRGGRRRPERGPRGGEERRAARPAAASGEDFGSGILDAGAASGAPAAAGGGGDGGPRREGRRRRRGRRGRGAEREHGAHPQEAGVQAAPTHASLPEALGAAPLAEGGEVPARWPEKPVSERQQQPPRLKLEELDDAYLKVEYFEVDPSLVKDAPAARPADAGRQQNGRGQERRGGRNRGRGRGRGDHGQRRGDHGQRPAPEGAPADSAREPGRRRRRRRRGRGGGGGAGDGGSQGRPEGQG